MQGWWLQSLHKKTASPLEVPPNTSCAPMHTHTHITLSALITAFFPPVALASTTPGQATLMRRASHRAVDQFWCFLQDFVEQRYAPEE